MEINISLLYILLLTKEISLFNNLFRLVILILSYYRRNKRIHTAGRAGRATGAI